MSTVTREHLAGLLAFKASCSTEDSINKSWLTILKDFIAQASAAPEQEPVAHLLTYRGNPVETAFKPWELVEFSGYSWAPLYTHADPSEVERLRADLDTMRRKNNEYCDDLMRTQQKLVEAQALLQSTTYVVDRAREIDRQAFGRGALNIDVNLLIGLGKLLEQHDAFLSATAQPADGVKS